MAKLFKFTLLLALLTMLSMPYAISLFMEREYNRNIAKLNLQLASKKLNLAVVGEFRPGWLIATARTKLIAKDQPNVIMLELLSTIQNGPLIVDWQKYRISAYKIAIVTSKINSSLFKDLNKKIYGEQNGLQLISTIAYDTKVSNNFTILPCQYQGQKAQVDWGGLTANVEFDSKFNFVNADFAILKFIYAIDGNVVNLKNVRYSSKHKKADYDLWLGDADLSCQQLEVLSLGELLYNFEQFILQLSSYMTADTITMGIKLKLNKFIESTSSTTLGPLAVDLQIAKLDPEFCSNIKDAIVAHDQNYPKKTMQALVLQLLAKQPIIKLANTLITTEQGKLAVDLTATLDSPAGADITKFGLFKAINCTAKIEIAKALTYEFAAKKVLQELATENKLFELSHEGTDMPKPALTAEEQKNELEKRVLALVNKLEQENILLLHDDNYSLEVEVKNAELKVNGRPIPLPW